jgi:hypothetical protein
MVDICSMHGEVRNDYSILIGEPGRKRSLGFVGVSGSII